MIDRAAIRARGCACYADSTEPCPIPALLDELARVEGELAKCGRENCMGWKLEEAENWVSEGRLLEVQARLTAATKAIENLQATLAHVEGERDEERSGVMTLGPEVAMLHNENRELVARLTAATEALKAERRERAVLQRALHWATEAAEGTEFPLHRDGCPYDPDLAEGHERGDSDQPSPDCTCAELHKAAHWKGQWMLTRGRLGLAERERQAATEAAEQLRAALEKARDTFVDMEVAMRMLGRHTVAEAMHIAATGSSAALAAPTEAPAREPTREGPAG